MHAKQKLRQALSAQKYTRKGDVEKQAKADEAVKLAQREYYTSPEGIKKLKEKAETTGKESDRKTAESFVQRRKEMIAASKKATAEAKAKKEKEYQDNNIQNEPLLVEEVKNNPLRQPIRGISDIRIYGVEYDYDYSHCSDSSCGEDDGICRDTVYEGLRVEDKPVDTRTVLAGLYSTSESNISDELVRIGNDELQLDRPDSYDAYAENGYYGEEPFISFADPVAVHKKLNEYFYSRPDAKDEQGVLPYVRGKGQDTTGLTPVNALKKSLREEKNGKLPAYVEKATQVSRGAVRFDKIKVSQKKHYDTAAPKVAKSPKGADKILGVVIKKGDDFILVDGHHRLKHARLLNPKSGTFLILH